MIMNKNDRGISECLPFISCCSFQVFVFVSPLFSLFSSPEIFGLLKQPPETCVAIPVRGQFNEFQYLRLTYYIVAFWPFIWPNEQIHKCIFFTGHKWASHYYVFVQLLFNDAETKQWLYWGRINEMRTHKKDGWIVVHLFVKQKMSHRIQRRCHMFE